VTNETRALVKALRRDGHWVDVVQCLSGDYVVRVKMQDWSESRELPLRYDANSITIEELLSDEALGKCLERVTGYGKVATWRRAE